MSEVTEARREIQDLISIEGYLDDCKRLAANNPKMFAALSECRRVAAREKRTATNQWMIKRSKLNFVADVQLDRVNRKD